MIFCLLGNDKLSTKLDINNEEAEVRNPTTERFLTGIHPLFDENKRKIFVLLV